ncbi:MAG: PD-(D/E)XK nuclease family protein [Oscillospiraceae bacterium]|nr:PD-(D/E)XK nuclease family protein [Oscillospiraceae bacterium]
MLRFVIGTAGTGKSTYITEKIVSLAKQGEKCLLIVPEQFSKTGEALLFSALDDTQSNLVELFSFTSLLRDVNSNHIKLSTSMLTSAGKAVMARRSVENVKKMLSLYSRQRSNFGFSFSLTETFDDFKRSGISRETLYNLAQNAPHKSVRLKELALIYSEYTGLMGNKFCDSEDLYNKLGEVLPLEYTSGTHIFIDGFESFSHGQLKIIEKMLADAIDVTVALTCDSLYDTTSGTGNFSFVQNTAAQLIRMAKNISSEISAPVVLRESRRFANNDLKNVDFFLQGYAAENSENSHVFVSEFGNQFDEVCYITAQINKLVQSGLTYNDITVVCPQMDKYENQLQESFTLAGIPYFIDSNRIISSSAPVVLFRSILSVMAGGLNSETVMPLLKTGLTIFDDDTIALLENYLYVWQDYDFDFNEEFALSPGGLKPQPDESEIPVLDAVNGIRNNLTEIFAPFYAIDTPSGGQILENCWTIACKLGCDEKIMSIIPQIEKDEDRQLLLRQWETAVECLDELHSITGQDILSCADMEQLFTLIAEGVKIGFAPQTQDCVMITDPKRMKLDSVKAVFITGAAQDIFPAIVSESGLITSADREYLKDNNYPLKNNFELLFSFENLYYYKALTSAGEYLYISGCKKNIDSRQMLSAQIQLLKEGLNLQPVILNLEDYAVTKEFFADYISGQATNLTRHSYKELLESLGITAETLRTKQYNIKDLSLLNTVLGDRINISPTHAQNYFQCAFMYFMQRILRVKPLEKAEFDARIAGDYLHFVAQKVMEKYGEDYYQTPWEEVKTAADEAVEKFIVEYYPPQIYNDVKFTAQYDNMKSNALQLLEYIQSEQANSLFRPVAFEERIGPGGRIPPLRIETGDGKKVNVTGVADRIDIYRGQESDFLRIIDYKTGNQKFDLDEIYNGLSTQLLLYMSALLESGFAKGDKPLKPGAVVYQPSDARFKFDKDDENLYTAVGMALDNPEISHAFDISRRGRYGLLMGDDKIKKAPGSEIVGEKKFNIILEYVKNEIKQMAEGIYSGNFDNLPLEKDNGTRQCQWCRYSAMCLHNGKTKAMEKNQFDKMEKEEV